MEVGVGNINYSLQGVISSARRNCLFISVTLASYLELHGQRDGAGNVVKNQSVWQIVTK